MEEELQERRGNRISLVSLIVEIRRNLLLIIIITLLFTVAGGIYGNYFVKTNYSSTATIRLKPNEKFSEYNEFTFATRLANTVGEIMKSATVSEKVAADYNEKHPNNPVYPATVRWGISVSAPENNFIVTVRYTSTRTDVQAILNQIIESSLAYLDEDVWFNDRVEQLDKASAAADDAASRTRRYIIIFLAFGLAVSAAIVILKIILNDTYVSKEDLERDVPVEVIAMIDDLTESKEGR